MDISFRPVNLSHKFKVMVLKMNGFSVIVVKIITFKGQPDPGFRSPIQG